MNHLEHAEQVKLVRWFRLQFRDVLIFAVPNGGSRNPREGKLLKDEGVLAGVPDLHVPEWSLWVELKAKGGRLSVAQKDVKKRLEAIGNTVLVPHGFAEAKRMILEFVGGRE